MPTNCMGWVPVARHPGGAPEQAKEEDTMGEGSGTSRIDRIQIEQHSSAGLLWIAAWLFTIGFLHLPFWRAVFALVVWPYYLGADLSSSVTP
jgi:hypothetical protein